MNNKFDLVVIGAGSGGLAAAKRAAKYGANVAIVEGDKVGGTCVIRGCVPKKLMVYAANARKNILNSEGYGLKLDSVYFDSEKLLINVRNEVNRLSELHLKALKKLNIKIFSGWGKFNNQNQLEIFSDDKKNILNTISAEKFLIAVGGKPNKLTIPGAEFGWSSDDIFNLDKFPESLLIVGGGYIACEFACILNNLGCNVTQLIRRENLLNGFDSDLALSLKDSMQSSGINLIFNDQLKEIKRKEKNFEFNLESCQKLTIKNFLVAIGREPNIDFLNIESLGVKMNGKFLKVDKSNQTNLSNIFAIGDIIEYPNLTPVAIEQGRVFADKYFGNLNREVCYDNIPKAVFSNPEIASVGFSESKAISLLGKSNIEIFKCKFSPMSQTFKKFKSYCLLKLVVNKLNDEVIGCHMIGESSAEIIQMASISLNKKVTKKEFDATMALHPTVSEEFVTMY